MAAISQQVRGFFNHPYFSTRESAFTHATLAFNSANLVIGVFVSKILSSPSVIAHAGRRAIGMNVFIRGADVVLGIHQGKWARVTTQVVACAALFFSQGIWISIGIDLLLDTVSYLRYTPPRFLFESGRFFLSESGSQIIFERGGKNINEQNSWVIQTNGDSKTSQHSLFVVKKEGETPVLKIANTVLSNLTAVDQGTIILGVPPTLPLVLSQAARAELTSKGFTHIEILPVQEALERIGREKPSCILLQAAV